MILTGIALITMTYYITVGDWKMVVVVLPAVIGGLLAMGKAQHEMKLKERNRNDTDK